MSIAHVIYKLGDYITTVDIYPPRYYSDPAAPSPKECIFGDIPALNKATVKNCILQASLC